MDKESKLALARVVIFIFGLLFLTGLQKQAKPYVIDGYRYQMWSSEDLIQTVSIDDLRNSPLESLTHIHIQPPGMDMLRVILVQFWPSLDINTALIHVDLSLYFLWSLLYSLSGVLIFQWLSELIDPITSFVASILLFLHPAAILYSTMLDTTFLSTFLILWMFYSLWKLRLDRTSVFAITVSSLLLFFFRSIFQLPFIFLLGVSLYLLNVPRRKLALFLIITGGICGLYIAKQYYQFGLITTSSLNGINLVRSVGMIKYPNVFTINLDGDLDHSLAKVLRRKTKINGTTNFNNYHYLEYNQQLTNDYKNYLFTTPARVLIGSYYQNLQLYFLPSSNYPVDNLLKNVIVNRISWRPVYDSIFSWPILNIILVLALAIWLAKALIDKNYNYRFVMAILLPALYIFLVSILFEKGENNRFKFFLEPIIYIFIVSQFYDLIHWFCQWLSTKVGSVLISGQTRFTLYQRFISSPITNKFDVKR
jgi:hypothetical protein